MRFVVPGKDSTCKPAAVTDLVALLSRPQADGGQVPLFRLLLAPGPPSASPVTTHPAAVFNIRPEELFKLLQVLLAQVDLVLDTLIPKPHHASGIRAIQVIHQSGLHLPRQCAHLPRPRSRNPSLALEIPSRMPSESYHPTWR